MKEVVRAFQAARKHTMKPYMEMELVCNRVNAWSSISKRAKAVLQRQAKLRRCQRRQWIDSWRAVAMKNARTTTLGGAIVVVAAVVVALALQVRTKPQQQQRQLRRLQLHI